MPIGYAFTRSREADPASSTAVVLYSRPLSLRRRRIPATRWPVGNEIQPWLGVWRPSQLLQVTILWSTSANHHLAWLVQQTLELKAIGARSGLLMPFLRS